MEKSLKQNFVKDTGVQKYMSNNLPIGIGVTGRMTWNKNMLAEFLDQE